MVLEVLNNTKCSNECELGEEKNVIFNFPSSQLSTIKLPALLCWLALLLLFIRVNYYNGCW